MGRVGEVCVSGLLLFFSITADARNCLKIDYENSPTVTVSGRITTQHRVPKGSELRAGDGPWLILDQPILADPRENPEREVVPIGASALQAWLGHKNIQHTVRYTELAPDRFKNFWR